MKVILTKDVKSIGKAGELHEVSDGYARNFLFPKGLATEANAQAMSELKNRESSDAYKKKKIKEEAQGIYDILNGKTVHISAKAGSAGRLFGSVTTGDIADAIEKSFHNKVDKRKINLKSDIKNYGTYTVEIKLHQGITAQVTVEVGE
ncbi:MAG: 50S ribosomal protein L9 [Clostridia bacterium]|nr:50S ribosomal protein L9 [Clostridia bacterium]